MMDYLNYEWLRAVHLIFVIAWMACLLMLPRLIVYQIEAVPDGETYQMMEKAIIRLRKIILTPSLFGTWLLGLLMISYRWPEVMSYGWLHIKLAMVIGITAFHGVFVGMARKVGTDKQPNPKMLRILNEVPFILAIIAVIAVVIEPFG